MAAREKMPAECMRSALWSIESQAYKASRATTAKQLSYHMRAAREKLSHLEQLVLDAIADAQAAPGDAAQEG